MSELKMIFSNENEYKLRLMCTRYKLVAAAKS